LIASRHHVARDRIRMIHRGIDSATFDPLVVPPGPVAKLRKSWGVSPKTKIVLQAARLTGLKGHRQTVEAAARLNRQGALGGAVVIFAGDALGKAAYRQELIGIIARHGLEDKVRLFGHCHDMPGAFLASCRGDPFARRRDLRPDQHRGAGHGLSRHRVGSRRTARDHRLARAGQEQFHGLPRPARQSGRPCRQAAFSTVAYARSGPEIGGRASARASVEFALSQMQEKTLAVYDELLGKDLAEQFEQSPALDCLRQEDLENHSER
jgi:hypothetical protein